MRPLIAALFLAATPLVAQTSVAPPPSLTQQLEGLREDSMRRLAIHAEPRPVEGATFFDAADAEVTLEAFRGQIVVLNFWATWCAPCRHEMPMLDALHAAYDDQGLEVVAVATGRNNPRLIDRFFEETGLAALDVYKDPRGLLGRSMQVTGLPVTVILDREGNEIARLIGEAEWDGPSARAIVETLLATGA